MTTIAFDGRYLAVDRLITDANEISGNRSKFKVLRNTPVGDLVIAFTGPIAGIDDMFYNFANTAPTLEYHSKDAEYAALAITTSGIIYEYSNSSIYPEIYAAISTGARALGSGRRYALGAMAYGASASKAVGIASIYNPQTGGCIDVIDTKTLEASVYVPTT